MACRACHRISIAVKKKPKRAGASLRSRHGCCQSRSDRPHTPEVKNGRGPHLFRRVRDLVSIAPILLIVVAIAGLVFWRGDCAETRPSERLRRTFKDKMTHNQSNALNKPAIDPDDRTRDIRRPLACEKCHNVRVFPRISISSDRNGRCAFSSNLLNRAAFPLGFLLVKEFNSLSCYATGQNDICCNSVAANLFR